MLNTKLWLGFLNAAHRGTLLRWTGLVLAFTALQGLTGCDAQRVAELEEGISSEADVKARFGESKKVWTNADGSRTLEYNRMPEGTQNYQITISAEGKMVALRQVLNRDTLSRVQPGMQLADVRRLLGEPRKSVFYKLKSETHTDWRWMDGSNVMDTKIFTVVTNPDGKVLSASSGPDNERIHPDGGKM